MELMSKPAWLSLGSSHIPRVGMSTWLRKASKKHGQWPYHVQMKTLGCQRKIKLETEIHLTTPFLLELVFWSINWKGRLRLK